MRRMLLFETDMPVACQICPYHVVFPHSAVLTPSLCPPCSPNSCFLFFLQLSAQFPQSSPTSTLNELPSPSSILSYHEAADAEKEAAEGAHLDVLNPTLDYVPPELVSLLITDS